MNPPNSKLTPSYQAIIRARFSLLEQGRLVQRPKPSGMKYVHTASAPESLAEEGGQVVF